MTEVLPFTGERFTPECKGEIWLEHWHRYILAARFCEVKRVLDAACGEGYGSAYLATRARYVCGVDANEVAIAHARSKYREDFQLEYKTASVTELPFPDASFDVVVSFETIEHLNGQEAMLREFRRVLAPDGLLLLSSPNRPIYSQNGAYQNPFHVKELDKAELSALLQTDFPEVRWYAQRVALASIVWSLGECTAGASLVYRSESGLPQISSFDPVYYFVVASNKGVQDRKGPVASTFADSEQSAYLEYVRTRHDYYVQRAELADMRIRVAALTSELQELRARGLANVTSAADEERGSWIRRLLARIGVEARGDR